MRCCGSRKSPTSLSKGCKSYLLRRQSSAARQRSKPPFASCIVSALSRRFRSHPECALVAAPSQNLRHSLTDLPRQPVDFRILDNERRRDKDMGLQRRRLRFRTRGRPARRATVDWRKSAWRSAVRRQTVGDRQTACSCWPFSRALRRLVARSRRLQLAGRAVELSSRLVDNGWGRQVDARLELENILRKLSTRGTARSWRSGERATTGRRLRKNSERQLREFETVSGARCGRSHRNSRDALKRTPH